METKDSSLKYKAAGSQGTPDGCTFTSPSSSHDDQRKNALSRLKGCVTLPDDFDDRKDLVEAVVERYEIQSNYK
jgi:hypothetical protein